MADELGTLNAHGREIEPEDLAPYLGRTVMVTVESRLDPHKDTGVPLYAGRTAMGEVASIYVVDYDMTATNTSDRDNNAIGTGFISFAFSNQRIRWGALDSVRIEVLPNII